MGFTIELSGRGESRQYRITPILPSDLHRELMAAIALRIREKSSATFTRDCYKNRDKVARAKSETRQGLDPDFSEKTFDSEKAENHPPEITPQLTQKSEPAPTEIEPAPTEIEPAIAQETEPAPAGIPLHIGMAVWGWVAHQRQWLPGLIEDFSEGQVMLRFFDESWQWLCPSHLAPE